MTDGTGPGDSECLGFHSFTVGFRGQGPHVHILVSLEFGGTSPFLAKKYHGGSPAVHSDL